MTPFLARMSEAFAAFAAASKAAIGQAASGPAAPGRSAVLVAAFAAVLVVGAVWAGLWLRGRRSRIFGRSDARRLAVPLLAVIPVMMSDLERRRRQQYAVGSAIVSVTAIVVGALAWWKLRS
jgi:hypothetical protein